MPQLSNEEVWVIRRATKLAKRHLEEEKDRLETRLLTPTLADSIIREDLADIGTILGYQDRALKIVGRQ